MGNAAAVLSGAWGAVTRRSEQSGSSRTALYTHAERVVQAVASAQARGISSEALWAQNKQLQAENEALWQAWGEAETLSASKQRALASAGAAMGLSLPQIVPLLAIVLPLAVVAESGDGGALGAAERGASASAPEGARPRLSTLGADGVFG